jgi:hypothetical protein
MQESVSRNIEKLMSCKVDVYSKYLMQLSSEHFTLLHTVQADDNRSS